MGKAALQPDMPEPSAYPEGFHQQDYDRVVSSLREDSSQPTLSFGLLHMTLLHTACYV
jgi:hypothetical protein